MTNPDDQPPLDEFGEDEDDSAPEMPHGCRFGEGQPRGRGRPRGSENRATILKRVARKRHKIKLDGKRRTVSSIELVLHTVRTEASRGNLQALKLQEALQARYAERERQPKKLILFDSMELTYDERAALYFRPFMSTEEVLRIYPYLRRLVTERDEYLAQSEATEKRLREEEAAKRRGLDPPP